MIKFAGTDIATGQPVLGIGLSRDNCDKLLAGQPRLFSTVGLGDVPPITVFVMGGDTEEDMAATMITAGAVRPDQVFEDPSLKNPNAPAWPFMKRGGEA